MFHLPGRSAETIAAIALPLHHEDQDQPGVDEVEGTDRRAFDRHVVTQHLVATDLVVLPPRRVDVARDDSPGRSDSLGEPRRQTRTTGPHHPDRVTGREPATLDVADGPRVEEFGEGVEALPAWTYWLSSK